MFEQIAAVSLRNRSAVLFFTVVIAIAGVQAFRGLPVEAFPDPTDTQVSVITLFPGQPSEEVERQIGLPLERALNGTPGLARLRNLSLFGLSNVTLTFEDGVDALFARAQVLEREAQGQPVEEAIIGGCVDRLRPVLMTAALAALGLVPAMMSRAIGSETQRPIAVVIVGGTISACALTLLVLPAMYRLWAPLVRWASRTRTRQGVA